MTIAVDTDVSIIFARPGGLSIANRAPKGSGAATVERPAEQEAPTTPTRIGRHELIDLLNQDFAREYQAIIAYVVYSQVIKGAGIHGDIQKNSNRSTTEELKHAIIIARQIDYLGGMPNATTSFA